VSAIKLAGRARRHVRPSNCRFTRQEEKHRYKTNTRHTDIYGFPDN